MLINGSSVRPRRGFALSELVAIVAVFMAAGALLVISGSRSGRLASLSESISNLKRFGEGHLSYAADYQDLLFSFSWRGNRIGPSTFPDLIAQAQAGGMSAHSAQAVDIIRRRANRPTFPQIDGWIPTVSFTHLVLADYNAEALPAIWMNSPEDKNRLLWAADPLGFEVGMYVPAPATLSSRWPYSSSYERAVFASTHDYFSPTQGVITQGQFHNYFQVVAAPGGTTESALADRRLSEVTYPAHKALMWDSAQRHHGTRDQYFMYPDSRVPVLFGDGAVRVRASNNANRGVDPINPRQTFSVIATYQPDGWEPPIQRAGFFSENLYVRYRYTRNGLGGRDFDADEVPVP